MHIDIVPNRNSRPATLLRESYRDGDKVKKRTLANLSQLPDDQIDAIRRVLRGDKLVSLAQVFDIAGSKHHGHVSAVVSTMKRLGFDSLLASRSSHQRELALAMIAARVLQPHTKLATTRWWHDTTLPQIFGIGGANEDDLYATMDWLLDHQKHIEKKLAARHLEEGGHVLYDLSSSYFEGKTCPLAALGHDRDGKKGKLQVNYGLLTDRRGCPVAVSVFKGNTGDPKTLLPQVEKVREKFGIESLVLVGDRGMISQKQIDVLKSNKGIAWITALRTEGIRKLVDGGLLQLDLFDERNLFELTHPDFPGERLVACRNPQLAKLRAHKRESLLDATVAELTKVRAMVEHGKLKGKGRDQIGIRVGKVINKYKVGKHFDLDIKDGAFDFAINQERVADEAALDGIYVIRTSLPAKQSSADETVRSYKRLSEVERAFRSLKSIDLQVRPIHHRLEDRVRAHIFLCMLAQYVKWHMVEAWRPLLFCDEDQQAKLTRDPVAPATRSEGALAKVAEKTLADGTITHSFRTLLDNLKTIVRNNCRRAGTDARVVTFEVDTTPTPQQQRALDLLSAIEV